MSLLKFWIFLRTFPLFTGLSASATRPSSKLSIWFSHSALCCFLTIGVFNLLNDLSFKGLAFSLFSKENRFLSPALLSVNWANNPLQILCIVLAHHFLRNFLRNGWHLVDPNQWLMIIVCVYAHWKGAVCWQMITWICST